MKSVDEGLFFSAKEKNYNLNKLHYTYHIKKREIGGKKKKKLFLLEPLFKCSFRFPMKDSLSISEGKKTLRDSKLIYESLSFNKRRNQN